MSDKELMQEALKWQEHIKVLANEQAEDELYQKRSKVFDWLIEQAEKVEQLQQEIEKEQKRLKNQIYKIVEEKFLLEKQLQQAQAKAERYKQALEFYADEETYETKFATDTDEICDPFTLIELDEGKKARQALEGAK